jgi:hypothetical protein
MMLISDRRGKMVMPRSNKVRRQAEGKAPHVTYIVAFTAVGPMADGTPPDARDAGDPAGGGGEGVRQAVRERGCEGDASANSWVTKDVYKRFGKRFIEFV